MGQTVTTALVIATALLARTTDAGEPVLDQQHNGSSYGIGSIVPLAQTITAGVGGQLTSVEMRANTFTGLPVRFEIQDVTDGFPNGTVLGSAMVDVPGDFASGANTFTPADFSASNIIVSAGQQFAIVAFPPGSQLNLNSSSPQNSIYSGGNACLFNGDNWTVAFGGLDLYFRTYVSDCAPPCLCEFTNDEPAEITIQDLLAYLTLWFTSDSAAEITGDEPASVDVQDLLEFLGCWFPSSNGAPC